MLCSSSDSLLYSGGVCDTPGRHALCYSDSVWSKWMPAYKTVGTRVITAFNYANEEMNVDISKSTDPPTSQLDEEPSSTVPAAAASSIETTGSVEANISTKNAPTNTESALTGQTSSSDNDPKDPSTPIGPIIRGAIGDLALITLIGVDTPAFIQ
ncbi:hypothetical protein FAVG1_00803 [Fusarium avenaceum]|nr:hypothetical protein FAVG1_00803 [Fusarium avenaceum]